MQEKSVGEASHRCPLCGAAMSSVGFASSIERDWEIWLCEDCGEEIEVLVPLDSELPSASQGNAALRDRFRQFVRAAIKGKRRFGG